MWLVTTDCVVERVQLVAVHSLCCHAFQNILLILLPLLTEHSPSCTHDCHQNQEGCNNNLLFGGDFFTYAVALSTSVVL